MNSLIWENQDPFKKNKREELIKKMVLKRLCDEIRPSLCPDKGSTSSRLVYFPGWPIFPICPVGLVFARSRLDNLPGCPVGLARLTPGC